MTPVQKFLQKLCQFYPSQGQPHRMNDTQIEVYLSALSRFSPEQLDQAGKRYMLTGKFFPALSELLALLEPKVDMTAAAHLAWTAVERALRSGGIYRGAHFEQGYIGEAVRQVFGSWANACQFDTDSPGWAIRRQTFLQIFPSIASRPCGPVTLRGLHGNSEPYRVPLVAGLPEPLQLGTGVPDGPPSHDEAVAVLSRMGFLPSGGDRAR